MAQVPKAFKLYTLANSAVSLGIFIGCAYAFLQSDTPVAIPLIFLGLMFLAELVPTKIPGSELEITMTMPLVVSLFLTHDLATAVVFTSIPVFVANVIWHRDRPIRSLIELSAYSTAAFISSVALASLGYLAVGSRTLSGSEGHLPLGSVVLPLALWVAVANFTNVIIMSLGMRLYNLGVLKVLIVNGLRWSFPNIIFSIPFSILFVSLYQIFGPFGIFLLIVPLLAGRHALNLSARQIDAYRDTITTLGSYMQHYHPYTKGHLERVAGFSGRLAREMRLPVQSLMLIDDAGMLHDIGKVGVNEEVLDKEGQLSPEDWAIIKQHPATGAEIISRLKHLEPIVPWVKGHHERPDGRGYPSGWRDGEIPLEAAVIAVADAFDAMTGGPDEKERRVYRTPLTLDQAMDQVRYGAGTQFDPRVVKAFMRVMARQEMENGK